MCTCRLLSQNQLFSPRLQSSSSPDCRAKSSLQESWAVTLWRLLAAPVALVSGLFSNGVRLLTHQLVDVSQAPTGSALSACQGTMCRHPGENEIQRQHVPPPLVWRMGQEPRGPGEHLQSHSNQALLCRFSVTIRCLFQLDFVTQIVLPGIVRKGQVLFILFVFKREIERETGRKIIFSITWSSVLKYKDGSNNYRAPWKSKF